MPQHMVTEELRRKIMGKGPCIKHERRTLIGIRVYDDGQSSLREVEGYYKYRRRGGETTSSVL